VAKIEIFTCKQASWLLQ